MANIVTISEKRYKELLCYEKAYKKQALLEIQNVKNNIAQQQISNVMGSAIPLYTKM